MSIPAFPLGVNLLAPTAPTPSNQTEFLDYQDGSTIDGSRYIDPATNDFAIQSNGHFAGMPSLQQQVWLAVSTQFNTTAVPNFGNDIQGIKVIGADIATQARAKISQALQFLTSTNRIRLNSVSTKQVEVGGIQVVFSWTDLSTGNTYQSNLPLKSL